MQSPRLKNMYYNLFRTHTGEKPFVCGYQMEDQTTCMKRFAQKHNLEIHIRYVFSIQYHANWIFVNCTCNISLIGLIFLIVNDPIFVRYRY